jgi:hypothetical protein
VAAFPGVGVIPQRSQITIRLRRTLASIWLPIHRVAGRPEVNGVITFGLRRKVRDSCPVQTAEPYHGRWAHFMIIASVLPVNPTPSRISVKNRRRSRRIASMTARSFIQGSFSCGASAF